MSADPKPVELAEAEREGLIDAIQDGTEAAYVEDLIAAREAAARREALLEAEAKHGYEVTRLTQERDYWRNGMDRHGPCVCDTNPETTDGPEEHCPHHGRNYGEWVERGVMLQAKVARVEALAEWLASRGTILTTRGAAGLQIRAALAEPERDEEGGR